MQKGTDWGGTYSRFSFDETKRYLAMLKEQGKVVLDDEFNVAQEILYTAARRFIADSHGNGAVGDGWKIVGTGASNNFTITGGNGTPAGAGRIYVAGIPVMLPSNILYSTQDIAGPALTTPAGARTDEVYLDVWLDESGPADDATIIDPTLGTETSRRLRIMYMVRVAEGGLTPADYTDATGITHHTLRLATLARTASAAIDAGMVADLRPRLEWPRGNIDHVLAQAAITPDRSDLTQLYDAIAVLIAAATPYATEVAPGIIEIATTAEVQALTDAVRAVTPAGLAAAAVAAATANRIIRRDAAGRAQVVTPSAADDIANKNYVDGSDAAHAALTAPHGSSVAATPGRLILRDANGRSQISTPSAAADIANKGYVDAALSSVKAWVVFDGRAPAVILDGFNVSSVVRTGIGQYTITFATPFTSDQYAVIGSASWFADSSIRPTVHQKMEQPYSASTAYVVVGDSGSGNMDSDRVSLIFLGVQ